jgi:DNA-binding NarL/FixJ family response regulator
MFNEEMMMPKIRVIVADDHLTFREGLCRLINDMEEVEVVGRAADGEETVNLSKSLKPDVAIIDIAMPKRNGIEATKLIKENNPEISVLILSAHSNQSYVLSSLRAGASGYLSKDTSINDLISAVRLTYAGDSVIDHNITDNLVHHLLLNKNGEKGNLELKPKEIQVVKQVAKGMRNKEIAREMNISERTVQSHLVNIFKKLNVDSRTESVLEALKKGWIDICDLS